MYKKMKFQFFFANSKIGFGHDKYVTTIWGETLEISKIIRNYAAKNGFETFLKNVENPCLDPKNHSDIIRNRKGIEICLEDASWNIDSEKKNFLLRIFLRNLA